jgi:hypothetical protein
MMTIGGITPRPAFRLLTLVLLLLALVDLIPATAVWRIVAGGLVSLPFLWLMAVWIGGNRILRLTASPRRADRAAHPSCRGSDPSVTQ